MDSFPGQVSCHCVLAKQLQQMWTDDKLCMHDLGWKKPLSANQGLQFEKLLPSLFLMPLLILVFLDPIFWQASSSSPTNPSSGPGLPPAVVLLYSSVDPLPLSAYVSARRNHWPRSGSPLTIQHVGKLFQGERQPFKSSGQRVKAGAAWESTERTLSFLMKGKWALLCGFLPGGYESEISELEEWKKKKKHDKIVS